MNDSYRSGGGRRRRGRRRVFGAVSRCVMLAVFIAVCYLALRAAGLFPTVVRADAPEAARESSGAAETQAAPDGYVRLEETEAALASGDLILVNGNAPYVFPDQDDLTCVYDGKTGDYFVRDRDVLLSRHVLPHVNDLMAAFSKATGRSFVNITSGYRSYKDQARIYAENAAESGEDNARAYVAQPGCSEHHTGLAMDLNVYDAETGACARFSDVSECAWITENAWRFGFVQRYSTAKADVTGIRDEPWHFRYVGVPHAMLMQEYGLCLEEYLTLLKSYPFDGTHLCCSADGQDWEIYYCPGLEVCVPESGGYTVSGNNTDGFIVTAAK